MDKYHIIDHPSDIGIEAFGKDKKELFENAAFGVMDMMFDLSGVKTDGSYNIKVSGDDPQSLLIAWLSELIYVGDSKRTALTKYKISKLTDKELEAEVFGGKMVKFKRSIKAATYSQLEMKQENGLWKARIIFDV